MRIFIILLLTNLLIALLDFFSYKAINTSFNHILSKSLTAKLIFFSSTIIPLITLAWAFIHAYRFPEDIFFYNKFYIFFGLFVLIFLPKINLSIFYGLQQLIIFITGKSFGIQWIGIGLAILSFLFVLHGLTINKDRFEVRTTQIVSNKIPTSFDGFKIVQISDLHIGSFHKQTASIEKLILQINELKPDLIVFTGDMVSNYAGETDEFIPILKQLNASSGKYAILGNHDYGEYVRWKSESDYQNNLNQLMENHKKMGFQLLNNNWVKIQKDSSYIQLLGVENWGLPPFPQYGEIDKIIPQIDSTKFSILLSHDPSHWRAQVLNFPFIDLTLSGHTHAMQFGLEIGSWQWSPVMWKYKEWGGLYENQQQKLYVNRGTGHIGLPGRIGIRPEITLLELKSIS
ncbi:MAG: metallophosphoesterase [Bacteroidales bacterium]|nr:metallophosphoesterase [Bacteroidales bacterium]